MVPSSETTHITLSPSKGRSEDRREFRRSVPSITINIWIRAFRKWMNIIAQWKLEAGLIDRLVTLSLFGEESSGMHLQDLQRSLSVFVQKDVKELEKSILDIQQNLDLMQRFMISSDSKVEECKIRMQRLSNIYSNLKNNILKELAVIYPVRIQ